VDDANTIGTARGGGKKGRGDRQSDGMKKCRVIRSFLQAKTVSMTKPKPRSRDQENRLSLQGHSALKVTAYFLSRKDHSTEGSRGKEKRGLSGPLKKREGGLCLHEEDQPMEKRDSKQQLVRFSSEMTWGKGAAVQTF